MTINSNAISVTPTKLAEAIAEKNQPKPTMILNPKDASEQPKNGPDNRGNQEPNDSKNEKIHNGWGGGALSKSLQRYKDSKIYNKTSRRFEHCFF